jgi:superfamily II DNA or RNA helicase
VGLLDKIIAFCESAGYTYKFLNNKFYGPPFEVNDFVSQGGTKDYMESISPGISPRDYQVEGVYEALRYNRKLLISPTGSGKSFMIYSVVRYHVARGNKILLWLFLPHLL